MRDCSRRISRRMPLPGGKADERDQRIDDDHAISVHGEIKGDGRHEQEDGEKRKQPGESSAAAGKADGQRQPRHQEQQDDHRGIRILHRQRHEIIICRQQSSAGRMCLARFMRSSFLAHEQLLSSVLPDHDIPSFFIKSQCRRIVIQYGSGSDAETLFRLIQQG